MKKTILAIAFVAIGAVSCKTEKEKTAVNDQIAEVAKTENIINAYKANVAESTVNWKGEKPTGSHVGVVSLEKGTIEIENGLVKSGEFVIDMNSISCTDLEAGKGKEDLEGHLKNGDFFDVEKFPTAKFEVSSSELKDGKVHVTGNLTLRDVTKSITIPATVTEADNMVVFKSDAFSIDRTDFGVTYKSKKIDAALKDKFIYDLMEISFEVNAQK
ncbi:YceI family protein [Tenacibaculum caenipelagi]|uniref:Polyisoprenoid-binding protein YceI n=1 Tax=Tenacibaculum caenipelagi TaxID=1325435 RepID=A0A4R6TID5_9FLAO|nr:YceI family protein [Tenacibaculum caenipelagi]TDQ30295.1 polyisoprenoid-binding protein YceI [Tenacibaculum caenipelagi]